MKFPTSGSFFRWKPAAWLRITGADAATFLQGQFTNDLRGLSAGEARYGLWLEVKGKVVADSFVVRDAVADGFWVGSYASMAATIRERLESFVIADDVVVEDETESWRAVTIFGEGVGEVVANGHRAGVVFRGRRGGSEHVEWVFRVTAEPDVAEFVRGWPELSAIEMERRRIEAGVPLVPVDLGQGDLPNEGGLEREAISYTKGCYLGQEVMARLHAMGQVRRRLVRVAAAATAPATLPAALFAAGRQVGELRSAVDDGRGGSVGLAMVSRLHVSADTTMSFTPDAPAVVRMLPGHD
ncbi:MAG: folate-binding protein YgfZ [Verrucomicrobia bacterium]|nr:folate-binding protein YgfZ [Verrucomicrobiota bacterium]